MLSTPRGMADLWRIDMGSVACADCGRVRELRRGMCGACYQRWRKAQPGPLLDDRTPAERFWSKVVKSDVPAGCWEWTAGKSDGYGVHHIPEPPRNVLAHKWLYEQTIGPVPTGLQLDHLCRNRACVRPDHLEPVTCRENLLRGDTLAAANARKTHCPRGHPYNEQNTVRRAGRRYCRACKEPPR